MSAALRQAAIASGDLPVGGVGAAELVQRAARRAAPIRQYLIAVAMSEGAISGDALDVGRLVGIGGIGGDPVAQHEIGRLRARLSHPSLLHPSQARHRHGDDGGNRNPGYRLFMAGRLRRGQDNFKARKFQVCRFRAPARSRAAPARLRAKPETSTAGPPPPSCRCRHAPGRKHRRYLQFMRNRTDNLDARDQLQLADLLHRQFGLAR